MNIFLRKCHASTFLSQSYKVAVKVQNYCNNVQGSTNQTTRIALQLTNELEKLKQQVAAAEQKAVAVEQKVAANKQQSAAMREQYDALYASVCGTRSSPESSEDDCEWDNYPNDDDWDDRRRFPSARSDCDSSANKSGITQEEFEPMKQSTKIAQRIMDELEKLKQLVMETEQKAATMEDLDERMAAIREQYDALYPMLFKTRRSSHKSGNNQEEFEAMKRLMNALKKSNEKLRDKLATANEEYDALVTSICDTRSLQEIFEEDMKEGDSRVEKWEYYLTNNPDGRRIFNDAKTHFNSLRTTSARDMAESMCKYYTDLTMGMRRAAEDIVRMRVLKMKRNERSRSTIRNRK